MNITNPYGPNTTLLLPGSCNAKCDFCFWNRDEAKINAPDDYLDKVFHNLSALPADFCTLSISGGEPTLSPWFSRVLIRLGQYRRSHYLERVVLTTHGGNLIPYLMAVGCVVDHINISRHAIGTDANYEVFKTDRIPSDETLRGIIQIIHRETPCDVTLNCVVQPDVTVSFCQQFIEYAKSLGADAVSFRKIASEASPTQTEMMYAERYGIENQTKCPVCRGMVQDVDGFQVRWKGSVNEPSVQTKGVYEAVIHPDGNIYADWGMKIPLQLNQKVAKKQQNNNSLFDQEVKSGIGGGCGGCGRLSRSSGGCGSRSSGGGC